MWVKYLIRKNPFPVGYITKNKHLTKILKQFFIWSVCSVGIRSFFLQWPIEIDSWIEHTKKTHQHTHRWSYKTKTEYDQLLLLLLQFNGIFYNEDTEKNSDITFIWMWFMPFACACECECVDEHMLEHVWTFLAHFFPLTLFHYIQQMVFLFGFRGFSFHSHFWNIHRLWICNHSKRRRWVWCHFYSRYWRMREQKHAR